MQSGSPLKRSSLVLSIGIVLVALSLLPLYAFLPACTYWESRLNLENGHSWTQELGFLVVGSYVKLNVLVDGGDNQITIRVLDMELNTIRREELVEGSGWAALRVPMNDYYKLLLINTDARPVFSNDKQVLIKVYYYFYNYIFLLPGITLVALGTALIVYYDQKRKTTHS